MTRFPVRSILGAAIAWAAFATPWLDAASAQGTAPLPAGSTPSPGGATAPAGVQSIGFEVLKGTWVRPDGGYTIAISDVRADGQIDATYFNPARLPFAKAQASRDGTALAVFLELQAGGYAGSTYTLAYDPPSKRLVGLYYQAVARQKFDVYFVRK